MDEPTCGIMCIGRRAVFFRPGTLGASHVVRNIFGSQCPEELRPRWDPGLRRRGWTTKGRRLHLSQAISPAAAYPRQTTWRPSPMAAEGPPPLLHVFFLFLSGVNAFVKPSWVGTATRNAAKSANLETT